MNFSDFLGSFREFLGASPSLPIDELSRYVFLSDFHMGDGGERDDLRSNRELATTVLARWYLERGYTLILGGDIEDLQKFKLAQIRKAWAGMYEIFDAFAARGALWKLVGNHDFAPCEKRSKPIRCTMGSLSNGADASFSASMATRPRGYSPSTGT